MRHTFDAIVLVSLRLQYKDKTIIVRGAYKAQSPTISIGLTCSAAGLKLKLIIVIESLAYEDPAKQNSNTK